LSVHSGLYCHFARSSGS